MMVGPGRADDDRRSAFLGRDIGADKAGRTKSAIAGAVLGRLHCMADKGNLALQAAVRCCNQIGQRGKIDDLCGQPLVASAAAVAKRGNRKLLWERADNRCGFRAPDPGRHHIGFVAHIAEPQRTELGDCPFSCSRFGFGPRLSRPDFRRQSLDNIIGKIVGKRLGLQRRDVRDGSESRGGQKQRGGAGEHGNVFCHGVLTNPPFALCQWSLATGGWNSYMHHQTSPIFR